MKSIYKRQLFMMVGIVFLSFSLLSAAFMLLSYRYIIADKRDAVERNAQDLHRKFQNQGRNAYRM